MTNLPVVDDQYDARTLKEQERYEAEAYGGMEPAGSHGDRPHSKIGGSKVPRYMKCPGSVPMSELVPREAEEARSIYAREGTCAHEVAELCLTHGTDPSLYIGTTHDGVEVTHEMAEYVRIYVNKVRQIAELEGVEPLVEVQFDLDRLGPPQAAYGTADAAIPGERHLHVCDLKYGSGIVVEVVNNEQLMFYAIGAALKTNRVYDYVTLWIIQPRADHEDGPIRAWTISWDELVGFRKRLQEAWRLTTLGADAPLNAGDHCRFCPAAAVCPELKAHAESAAQRAFANLPVPASDKKVQLAQVEAALPAPAILTDDQLAEVVTKSTLIRRWLDSVDKYVHDKIVVRGEKLPGFKAVKRYGNRAWADEISMAAELEQHGLRPDDLVEKTTITPAEAERRLKERNPDLTLAEVKEIVAPLVLRPERGYNIVDEEDKRPEATLASEAQEAFAAVTNPTEGD